MSWTDKLAIETILKLRDRFNVERFIETGTFKGVNAKLHARNFKYVYTCEVNPVYYEIAQRRLARYPNVMLFPSNSPTVLKWFKKTRPVDTVFVYLDAHFYDSDLPLDKRFVVVEELETLESFGNCIICIHDFDCEGLGHIVYDGIPLGWDLVGPYLERVSPNFYYYTNTREFCSVVTTDEVLANKVLGLEPDTDTLDNLAYAWSNPEKTNRGILYAVPEELDLTQFRLKVFNSSGSPATK